MIEPAIVFVRLLQYCAAAILLGSSLFFAWLVPGILPAPLARDGRRTIAAAAALLAVASVLAVALQGSLFAGSLGAGFAPDAFVAIVSSMGLGKAAVVRAGVAALALVWLTISRPGRGGLGATAVLGTIAAASLAWLGHAAASQGWFQLSADILHALTASVWIGALMGFVLLVRNARAPADFARLCMALRRFSAVGVALVLMLGVSGLVNGWYLVGLSHVGQLPFTRYGQVLLAKLAAFPGMLLLAAANRYRLTPALDTRPDPATVRLLRRSLAVEAALGFAVLALVAWLGTLEPLAGS